MGVDSGLTIHTPLPFLSPWTVCPIQTLSRAQSLRGVSAESSPSLPLAPPPLLLQMLFIALFCFSHLISGPLRSLVRVFWHLSLLGSKPALVGDLRCSGWPERKEALLVGSWFIPQTERYQGCQRMLRATLRGLTVGARRVGA